LKVSLKLVGFPDLCRRLGGDEVGVEVEPATVGCLLEWLQENHAGPAGTRLFAGEGRVDPAVQIIRNGSEWIPQERLGTPLSEGDQITLMVLVAGG
jgi:molybdopterin converting factor small subunit